MKKRKTYTTKDLAEARVFAKDFCFVDGDNYGHNLDEDKNAIPQVAELIAKVRRRGERIAKQLRIELWHANERESSI